MWQNEPTKLPAIVASIQENDSERQYNWAAMLRMYMPVLVPNYLRTKFSTPISLNAEAAKLNIVNSICRHATNYFGRSFPKPVFLPYGGKEIRDQADIATRFVNGLFYQNDLFKEFRQAVLHAAIGGTGVIKVVESFDTISYEAVLPTELFIPEDEAECNNPRSIFQVKYLNKDVVQTMYPEYANQIKAAQPSSMMTAAGYSQQIRVVEGIHLPSGPDAKDGRHIIAIEPDIVVFDEEYTDDEFPYAFFKYFESPVGFWGEGLGQLLLPYQVKVNQLLRNIEANIKAGGNLKIWVNRDSGISEDHLSNDLRGIVLMGQGAPPQHLVQPLVSPEILNHLNYLINSAWQAARFSPEMGVGKLPTGVTSRVALLTSQDMLAEQHILTGKQLEDTVMQVARKTMAAAKRIYERTGSMETFFKSGKTVEKISLADALMDDDAFRIEVQASARTRDSVSGRLELAEYLADRGIWGKEQVMEALDLPGVFDDIDSELAEIRNIDSYLTAAEQGEYKPPHEYLNLEMAKFRAVKRYNQLEYEMADPDVLQRVSQFIDAVDDLIKKALMQQQPMQPAPTAQGPIVVPEAPQGVGPLPVEPPQTPQTPQI